MYAYDNYYRIDMKLYIVYLVYVLAHNNYALSMLVANVIYITISVYFRSISIPFIISASSINIHIFSCLKRNMLILYIIPDPMREKPNACSAHPLQDVVIHCHDLFSKEKVSSKSVFIDIFFLSLNKYRSRLGG